MRNQNRFVLAAALAAALVFPVACATTHTTSSTSTDNGMTTNTSSTTVAPAIPTSSNSQLNTVNGNVTTVTNPDGSITTTTQNADGSLTTITRSSNGTILSQGTVPMASSSMNNLNSNSTSTTVTNPDGSVTTTTRNADGSTTTVTRSSSGTILSSSNVPASTSSTTTSVTTGGATAPGSTKITTTTTTTTYAQPMNNQPATASATVTTAPPMASAGQVEVMQPYGFGHSRNHGRSVDLNVFADWANFSHGANGGGGLPGTATTGNLGTSFKNANGYGASLNAFFAPTLSLELGASRINPGPTFTPAIAGIGAFTGTKVRMTPITAALQWHFLANHSFDPYVGLGGAYVMFNSRTNITNAGATGFQSVHFSDRGGPLADAGIGFGFGHSFGLIVDAKYIRLRGNGTTNFGNGAGTTPTAATFDLNPLIVSAGIRFGF